MGGWLLVTGGDESGGTVGTGDGAANWHASVASVTAAAAITGKVRLVFIDSP